MITNRRVIETLDHFVEKSGNEEPLANRCWNAAGAKIKELVFVDLSGSCAVSATDIICENFQAGH
jgi:hypothetical protein